MRRFLILLMVLSLAAVVAVAVAGVFLLKALEEPYAGYEEAVVFDYPDGTPTRELAAELEQAGVVRSQYLFLAARTLRPHASLQAGEYRFDEPASVWEIYQKLVEGRVYLRPLTIPEGLTRFETAERIAQAGYGEAKEILELTADPQPIRDLFPEAESLEGCLFPETYLFPKNAKAQDVIDAMLARFRTEFKQASQGKTTHLEPYEVLTMAAMIEKETAVPSERPLVSSVYHNRLRSGMLLQCDPTIIYGLILEDRYNGTLLEHEIRDPHDYNTYVHPGLPPGPIASPGRGSLRAAFRPVESEYLFFVAQSYGDPQHVFSKNLREHNRAVAAYRKTR